MRLFNPEVFQGNLNRKNYFEGWYLKHVSKNREHVFSFIPGIALTKNDKHAFVQFINGITGETAYVKYPLSDFSFSRNLFDLKVGNSHFSEIGIQLNIDSPELKVTGELKYSNLVKYPKRLGSPGIMGWYSFVPFMECKHGIGSVLHSLEGTLLVNGEPVEFSGGKGYIEKDWGTSFPESWIWLHCNTFEEPDCSFTFSVAKIPWLGSFFMGHICFLYLKGKFHLFATYNNSEITHLSFSEQTLNVELKRKDLVLKVKAVQRKAGHLKAPLTGKMDRMIKESVDSNLEVSLYNTGGKTLFSSKGERAGMEIIEKILTYF